MALDFGSVVSSPPTPFDQDSVRRKLAAAAKSLAILKSELLDQLRAKQSQLKQDDFLWHALLESFATMGGADGWKGLIGNPVNYAHLSFGKLNRLKPTKRLQHIIRVCLHAKIRYPERKAKYIKGCFDHIQSFGGLGATQQALLDEPNRDAKIDFLLQFPGIGPKYARNMMMDLYHPDFHDSIAIDSRLQKVSGAWGLSFSSYEEQESFFVSIAHAAGINGWALDRLMFWFQSVFLPPISTDVTQPCRILDSAIAAAS